ncbi:MAG: dipeptidase [bacterium]|nr:dipeptidase [bacterium]
MVNVKRIIFLLLFSSFFLVINETGAYCFTIIAGKDATEDGSVLLCHNENDRGRNYFVNVHKIPGKRKNGRTGFLWLEIPGVEFADSYMNEHGVVITSNTCRSRENSPQLTDGGIGFKLRRMLAEKATSARHAVEIAGKLIHRYGYYSSGRSYAIADSTEGWILQVVKGKHWIALRVPDDEIAVVTNRYTIGNVDFTKKETYKASPDIVTYAIRRQWHHPTPEEPFNFATAYSEPRSYNNENNILREWRAASLLAKKKFKPDAPISFSFKPRKKVREADLFRVLRDHYEDTKYDLTRGYKEGSPNSTDKRTICTEFTRYSFVAQLRRDMPKEIGNLVWIAFRRPDSNAYSPWYFSISAPPEGYTRGNPETALNDHLKPSPDIFRVDSRYAYWNFARLSELVDRDFRSHIKIARKEWRNFENYLLKTRKKREKEFDYFIKKDKHIAIKLITNYVWNLEYRKWFLTSDLIEQLTKVESE